MGLQTTLLHCAASCCKVVLSLGRVRTMRRLSPRIAQLVRVLNRASSFLYCSTLIFDTRSRSLLRRGFISFRIRRFGRSSRLVNARQFARFSVPPLRSRFPGLGLCLCLCLDYLDVTQQQLRCPAGLPAARPAEWRCLQRPGLLSSFAFRLGLLKLRFATTSRSSYLVDFFLLFPCSVVSS